MVWGAVIAAIGVAYSAYANEEAKDERADVNEMNRARQGAADAAKRRTLVRQQRIKEAQVIAESETRGVAGGSSETAALGSVATQFAANTAFLTGQASSADAISSKLQNAADWQTKAGYGRTVQQLGMFANANPNLFKTQSSIPDYSVAQAQKQLAADQMLLNVQPSTNIY